MSKKYNSDIEQELIEYLGEDNFFKLVDNFAGTRLYISSLSTSRMTTIEECVGRKAAEIMNRYYGGSTLDVPLSRSFRALRYRQQGMSNRHIALRLGIREDAVEKIFTRQRSAA
ncbi:hypothetical protein [Brucella inopinata]|uniref:hypothetical protein n=1 Tax=Brucella inopinata TaxID=1218315 RepID=UPI00087106D0|nr:hypothetical protein [Brucella inopinata]SCD25101.1 hypothetical protein BR141012304_20633 [Brucella inopinata]